MKTKLHSILALIALALPGAAQTIDPAFAADYSFSDLGSVPGLPPPAGGLTFKAGDPNTILIGGSANNAGGKIYSIGVVRDSNNHITGFNGTATLVATATGGGGGGIDGGLDYGPGNVLFYTSYADHIIGQIKPGSTTPDKLINLTGSGISGSVGGLYFVPPGFPGEGHLKIFSYNAGTWHDAQVTPDGTGTFDITNVGPALNLGVGQNPEGAIYVLGGNPGFTNTSILMTLYVSGTVVAFEVDANGDPIPATIRNFMTGLGGAEGAVVDPLTNDFLFSTFGGGDRVIVVRGFDAPTVPLYRILATAGILNKQLIGTNVADAPGFQFTKLGVPAVTNLRRAITRGEARNTAKQKFVGLVLGRPDDMGGYHFTMPLRGGEDIVPTGDIPSGAKWKSFPREPFMDYTDDACLDHYASQSEVPLGMGFYGRMAGPGIRSDNDDVLAFYGIPEVDDEVLVIFAREGSAAPGVGDVGNPGRFKSFVSAAIAERCEEGFIEAFGAQGVAMGSVIYHRQIAFTAKLQTGPDGTTGPGGVDKTNNTGLWIWPGSGEPVLVLRKGQDIAGHTVKSFVALKGPKGHGHGFTADDDPDHYATFPSLFSTTVLVTATDGTKHLIAASLNGLKILATVKVPSAWPGGSTSHAWAGFKSFFRNGNGNIGVLANLSAGTDGITTDDNLALFAEDSAGDLQKLLSKGTPFGGSGELFSAFKNPVMNRNGAHAFAATLKSPTTTAKAAFHHQNSVLTEFFRTGAPATGAEGGVWKNIVSHALPDGTGPLFTSKLLAAKAGQPPAPGGVTLASDLAIWGTDANGTQHQLLREGQPLFGKTVRTFRALTGVGGSVAQSRTFNSRDDVLVQVIATDKTIHLLHIALPPSNLR